MSLSLKAELETWAAALEAYDKQDFEKALDSFSYIADSSKILTNMGLIYATIGEHESALEHFTAATNLDPYLAIAHFQSGVSNFLIERYDAALLNFEDAYLYLRGNEAINYEQIGLKFKLFSAEILFNKGLTQLNLGYFEQGMADLQEASKQKVTDEHGVIDEAIRDRGEGYTVFSIPVGVLYRPSENKLKNSKTKDYLGKAKLVAASDSNDAFTEFTGVKRLQQASADNTENTDSDPNSSALTRSATVPAPRTEPLPDHRAALERSNTTLQPGTTVSPDMTTTLASRRTQSVSNPVNVPPLPLVSGLSRNNSTRVTRTAPTPGPPRVKTPQGGPVGTRAGEEVGSARGGEPTALRSRPSLRRLRGQAAPEVALQPAPVPPPLYSESGQQMGSTQDSPPVPVQGGHLTQFYDTYIDAYTDEPASRPTISRTPGSQPQSNAPSPHRRSPATSPFHQSQAPEQPPWIQPQPVLSPVRSPSSSSANSGLRRVPSRGTNLRGPNTVMEYAMESNLGMPQDGMIIRNGGINNGGATARRKPTRRQMTRRVMQYDEEVDDGSVGEYEMANIRIKLHYRGDVRGMAIPPTTTYDEFVDRVTTKFGTSLTGLGMKFVDEDGTKISLRDESDFELAIETAREGAEGRSEGKLQVWCVDIME